MMASQLQEGILWLINGLSRKLQLCEGWVWWKMVDVWRRLKVLLMEQAQSLPMASLCSWTPAVLFNAPFWKELEPPFSFSLTSCEWRWALLRPRLCTSIRMDTTEDIGKYKKKVTKERTWLKMSGYCCHFWLPPEVQMAGEARVAVFMTSLLTIFLSVVTGLRVICWCVFMIRCLVMDHLGWQPCAHGQCDTLNLCIYINLLNTLAALQNTFSLKHLMWCQEKEHVVQMVTHTPQAIDEQETYVPACAFLTRGSTHSVFGLYYSN
jgi:hypothetical protein